MKEQHPVVWLIGVTALVAAIWLTFAWFDWRLFVVIFLFLLSNNIDQSTNYVRRRKG